MEPPLVKEIVCRDCLCVSLDCLLSQAVRKMHENRATCVLIVEEGEAKGIITESDAVGLLSESFEGVSWKDLSVNHVMTSPVISVSQDVNVLEAIEIAMDGRIRNIVVLGENSQIAGVLNQSQIVQALALYCRQDDLW